MKSEEKYTRCFKIPTGKQNLSLNLSDELITELNKTFKTTKSMKLTDKCKQDFEKWFSEPKNEEWDTIVVMMNVHQLYIYDFPQAMQYGVLVDFFSEKYLKITIQYHPQLNQYSFNIIQVANLDNIKPTTQSIYHVHYNGHCDRVYYDIEEEAREQSITKANEIYNKPLKL